MGGMRIIMVVASAPRGATRRLLKTQRQTCCRTDRSAVECIIMYYVSVKRTNADIVNVPITYEIARCMLRLHLKPSPYVLHITVRTGTLESRQIVDK